MHALRMLGVTAALTLAAALGAQAAAQVEDFAPATLMPGNYDCTTRNGRVLDGRGFTIIDDRHYMKGASGGVYEIQGNRVYFDLGELDGKQVRILSSGRIKFSSDIFCIYAGGEEQAIPEEPQPEPPTGAAAPADGNAPAAQPPAEPAPAAPAKPVPPKVIKVDPASGSDPRLKTTQP